MENKDATNYVLFAVGGSGAKVAEAMINIMSLGIPIAVNPSGAGFSALNAADSLTVVRIDPDKACRSAALQDAVGRYQAISAVGGHGESRGLWSLTLKDLVTIHPMDALGGPAGVETLEAKLASREAGRATAISILRLFYEQADLTTSFDRGFFQRPFIGAAIIAAMGEIKVETDSEIIDLLQSLRGQRLRAFIVGSMYGGTGAAGIPVLSKIIRQFAEANQVKEDWQVAGCLLGPYFYPPEPPLRDIDWGREWRPDGAEALDTFLERKHLGEKEFLEGVRARSAGKGLAGPGLDFTYDEIRQIARGYYAKPDEIERRAVASWDHYQRHAADLFDKLYLLGLRNPTRYGEVVLAGDDYPGEAGFSDRIRWSNGGRNQISPLHAVEYAAACLGFHFFSQAAQQQPGTMLAGVHHHDSSIGDALCWADLALQPTVRMDRWLAAALAGYNWLAFSLIPYIQTRQSFENARNSLPALHRYLDAAHYETFHRDLNVLAKNIGDALLHTVRALGWEEERTAPLMRAWLRSPVLFGKARVFLKQEAATYAFGGWRLEQVDAEAIGKTVPIVSELAALRGVSTETQGANPVGIAYLQSLWNYLALHMVEIREGAV